MDSLSKWLTCPLRVLLMMLVDYVACSINSTSLRSPRRSNLIIVASHLMFTLVDMVTWVDVGGGCYMEHEIQLFRESPLPNIGLHMKSIIKAIEVRKYL